MRSRPVLLKLFAHPLGDQAHGQPRSIRGHNRAGLTELRHAREEFSLDFQIFRDCLDDPVRLRAPRQIIFEVSDRHFLRE